MKDRRVFRRVGARWLTAGVATLAVAVTPLALAAGGGVSAAVKASAPSGGLGQDHGLLASDHFTLESAIQVDLSTETVRLPVYKRVANGKTAWFVFFAEGSWRGRVPTVAHDGIARDVPQTITGGVSVHGRDAAAERAGVEGLAPRESRAPRPSRGEQR